MDSIEDLTPEEKKAFESLSSRPIMPNQTLEDRTVKKLLAEGLIVKVNSALPWMKWAASLAAAIVIFILGMFVNSQFHRSGDSQNEYRYVFLLHQGDNFVKGDPANRFEEYRTWMNNIRKEGIAMTGEKLDDPVLITGGNTSSHIQDEQITGFFMLDVVSDDAALRIARESPHVKYGGKIEIRKIVDN